MRERGREVKYNYSIMLMPMKETNRMITERLARHYFRCLPERSSYKMVTTVLRPHLWEWTSHEDGPDTNTSSLQTEQTRSRYWCIKKGLNKPESDKSHQHGGMQKATGNDRRIWRTKKSNTKDYLKGCSRDQQHNHQPSLFWDANTWPYTIQKL